MNVELSPHAPATARAASEATQDPQPNGMIQLDSFLRMTVAQGVSDIHLRVGHPPRLRKDGDVIATKLPPVSDEAMKVLINSIVPPGVVHKMQNKTDFDFSFSLDNLVRFRANLFYEMNKVGLVLRLIPTKIPALEDIGVPLVLKKFTEINRGLVLITGPTGSGKSTTLASMLNCINVSHKSHIVTLEDPVEFLHTSQMSVITQRQLGVDTDSFPNGVKYALRQDPDVILVGELRDRETILSALNAAETGHLVFSTLHTSDAVQTINRIINAFDPHERDPIRRQLAVTLQGTVSQRLAKKIEGKGRVAICEIMAVTPAVRDYIQRNEIEEIYQLMNRGDFDDMCSLNRALYMAVRNEQISQEEAIRTSDEPTQLQQMLRGAFQGTSGNA
jgi:twitching motility protein PilT